MRSERERGSGAGGPGTSRISRAPELADADNGNTDQGNGVPAGQPDVPRASTPTQRQRMTGRPNRWGPWEYDSTTNEIRLIDGQYEIDLNRCESSAAVLDWIFQIAKKPWAGDCVIANLVWAIDEILDPQATLCSFGADVSEQDSDDSPVAPRRRDVGEWETETRAVA